MQQRFSRKSPTIWAERGLILYANTSNHMGVSASRMHGGPVRNSLLGILPKLSESCTNAAFYNSVGRESSRLRSMTRSFATACTDLPWQSSQSFSLRTITDLPSLDSVKDSTSLSAKPTRRRISYGIVVRPRLPKMRRSFLFTRPAPFHRSLPGRGSRVGTRANSYTDQIRRGQR